MEPELRKDRHASDATETKRPEPQPKHAAFTAPFASEGLEGIRDSHC
ncbi:hypothetical protein [Bradyrhizobium betae]|nr:hypothetical protein [Bradyrhizobium betae]MCS3729827.1 hypothetical protein [Bradyrhizobium betae]